MIFQLRQGQREPRPGDITRTDTGGVGGPTWPDDDDDDDNEVIRLREWGTDTIYALPPPSSRVTEWTIGAEETASLQLIDQRGLVSRIHARLVREGAHWQIKDLCSKNGIRRDGGRCDQFALTPGVEISIGSFTLIAETPALVRLRGYLTRVLGWEATNLPAVDLAIRAIRTAATRREPLVIAGEEDLVAVARQIHRRTRGPHAPFVVCGPRPRESDASLRVTATRPDPRTALELATGGTICVRSEDVPAGFDQLIELSRDPHAPTQLIICANKTAKRMTAIAPSIGVPALARRTAHEVDHIVIEYAEDGREQLHASKGSFTMANCAWVVSHAASSFTEIEVATLRLIARNDAGSVHRAAARLGISHVALGKWFRRRGLAE